MVKQQARKRENSKDLAARSQADRIINLFGGVRALSARAEEHGRSLPPTTISGWRNSGLVPVEYHKPLLQIALEDGLSIYATDFLPWPEFQFWASAEKKRARAEARR